MSDPLHDRTLALAGLFQAARLAQTLAREGRADERAFAASLKSLFSFDAGSVAEVYGGATGVLLGLQLIEEKLNNRGQPLDFELARYAISMIQLEAQLRRLPSMQETIRTGLKTIAEQMRFFESASAPGSPVGDGEEPGNDIHPKLAEKIGELYQQTLSTLTPRIMRQRRERSPGQSAGRLAGARGAVRRRPFRLPLAAEGRAPLATAVVSPPHRPGRGGPHPPGRGRVMPAAPTR